MSVPGVGCEHLGRLVPRGRRKRYEAGQAVSPERGQAEELHVMLRGPIRVFKTSAGGREQISVIISPAGPAGEVAGAPRAMRGPGL